MFQAYISYSFIIFFPTDFPGAASKIAQRIGNRQIWKLYKCSPEIFEAAGAYA
jgi:hypothetical protein